MAEHLQVEVARDALDRFKAGAERAIEELVWNALDADAGRIDITFRLNELGGIDSVVVEDDGDGMTADTVRQYFGRLGGSWKPGKDTTETGRRLHGRDGQGRWRAYGLGRRVRWESNPRAVDERVVVEGAADAPERFDLEVHTGDSQVHGTRVEMLDIFESEAGNLEGDRLAEGLTQKLALYLTKYPVHVTVDGRELDVSRAVGHRSEEIDLGSFSDASATLEILEWRRRVTRELILCDEDGFALDGMKPGIQARAFPWFTAYLRWAPFRGIHDEVGPLLSMDPRAQDAIESGKAALRRHFRERAAERRQETIADLKAKGLYPYEGEPEGAVAQAEREVFDIILVEVADSIPKDGSAAKLTVNLMKESLERDPVSLSRVLRSVVDLSEEQLQELEELLEQTTLGNIIASARTVVDRLDFVAALELLVYDPESARQLKERSQLHRIIANETWVFGEEFSKVVDDESLTKVLKAHVASLGRSELAPDVDDEVLRADGSRGIVDLMLSRVVPQARNRREHLIIELKRPSVSVGMEELNQVYRYAHAVAADPRFADSDVSWEFIVVSSKLTEEAQAAVQQRDRPIGVYFTGEKQTIWAHTWGQVIEGANHRMKFMRERLDATVNEGTALEYLRRKHGDYLPPTIADR